MKMSLKIPDMWFKAVALVSLIISVWHATAALDKMKFFASVWDLKAALKFPDSNI